MSDAQELEPITALVPADQMQWLRDHAAEDERSLAWVMRRALSEYIQNHERKAAA